MGFLASLEYFSCLKNLGTFVTVISHIWKSEKMLQWRVNNIYYRPKTIDDDPVNHIIGSCAPPVRGVSICRNAHVIMWSVLLAFIEPSARTTLHAQLLENEEQDGGGRSKFARPAGKSQGKLKERGRKYSKTNRQRSGWTEVLLDESVLISNVYLVENKLGPVSKLRLRLAHKLKYHMC